MQVKEAVAKAKAYVSDFFVDDGISDVRLEEVGYDDLHGVWELTMSFVRRGYVRDTQGPVGGLTAALEAIDSLTRIFRVVRLRDDDGRVLSVKLRDASRGAAWVRARHQPDGPVRGRPHFADGSRATPASGEVRTLRLRSVGQGPQRLWWSNVVTETSTLLGHGRKSSTDDYAQVLAGLIRDLDEVYVASKDAVERSDFARLGVTDSALLQMASEEFDLLTDDEPLYRTAVEVGCRAVLFSQLREYARQIR